MKGLLIEFDVRTGRRAGNISPKDPALPCYGWQNLDVSPQVEIRLITDNRDVAQYRKIAGVKILETKEEINQAINDNMENRSRYKVEDESLMRVHLEQKKIDLDQFKDLTPQKTLEQLFKRGIVGIIESKRKHKLIE